jgi:hypothetical protein
LLVKADGSFSALPTEGMYSGGTVVSDGSIFLSDATSEIRVDRDSVERRDRHDDNLLLDTVIAVGDEALTVFNTGPGYGTYFSDVAAWTDEGLAKGRLRGELWGVTECGGEAYALLGAWRQPHARARIVRLDVEGESVRLVTARHLETRFDAKEIASFGCVGTLLTATAVGRKSFYVSTLPVKGKAVDWRPVRRGNGTLLRPPGTRLVSGESGIFFVTRTGTATRVDPSTGSASVLTRLEQGNLYQYAISEGELVVGIEGAEQDPVVVRVDLASGETIDRLVIDGMGKYLSGKSEYLDSAPSLIR